MTPTEELLHDLMTARDYFLSKGEEADEKVDALSLEIFRLDTDFLHQPVK